MAVSSDNGRDLDAGQYWYDDLQVGDRFQTGGMIVTEAHVVTFAGLSGDFFDLHMDDKFAVDLGFPRRVAHGILGLALVDGLKNRCRVKLMGIASLGWNWSFRAPIFIDDRIFADIKVAERRLTRKGDRGIIKLHLTLFKDDGVVAQEGDNTVLMKVRHPDTAISASNLC
jgi:3-hydroxybutyryl-CoA dehydratase